MEASTVSQSFTKTRLPWDAKAGMRQIARACVPQRLLQYAASLLTNGPWQAQRAVHTALDRYPEIFAAAARMAEANRDPGLSRPLRVLSFGCSTGEECYSLSSYFSDADIFGCDINPSVLSIAKHRQQIGNITFFNSSPEMLRKHGPFDVVFCMSSLCLYPEANRPEGEAGKFPFSAFEDLVSGIDSALAPGGLLVIYNSNYSLRMSGLAANYDAVQVDTVVENGFVNKLHPSGQAFTVTEAKSHSFCQRVVSGRQDFQDRDFTDFMFRKRDGKASSLSVSMTQPLPEDAEVLSCYTLSDEDAFSPSPDLLTSTLQVEVLRSSSKAVFERVRFTRKSVADGQPAIAKQFARYARSMPRPEL